MKQILAITAIGWCLCCGSARASDRLSMEADPAGQWAQRIQQLEAETAALRAELEAMHQRSQAPGGMIAMPVSTDAVTESAEPGGEVLVSMDELRAEMKKLAWTKDNIRIVPYGNLWGTAAYDTNRTFPGAFVLYAFSPQPGGGALSVSRNGEPENQFVIDTRRTRLGIDVTGPPMVDVFNANNRARVEIDFMNDLVRPEENRAGVLLRHAFAELYNEHGKLLAGQTWDLISPNMPHTVSYSVGWNGGNMGFRRMQLRAERYLAFSDGLLVTPAVAFCQNIITDGLVTDRESSNWPVIEGRLGCTLGPRDEGCKPIVFGVSGHIGEQQFDFVLRDNALIRTWSLNADVLVPITDRLSFQGEFFTGADLGTFFGGVSQGVNLATYEGVYSTGGWFEVGYDWTSKVHTYAGYGIDDPWDQGLWNSPLNPDAKTYNEFAFANLIYDVTKRWKLALEVTRWQTGWLQSERGEAVRYEFAGHYDF